VRVGRLEERSIVYTVRADGDEFVARAVLEVDRGAVSDVMASPQRCIA